MINIKNYEVIKPFNVLILIVLSIVIGIIASIGLGKFIILIPIIAFFLKISINIEKKFILMVIMYIILFPKIAIMNVPGTYIGIRGEDILIALFIVSLLMRQIYIKEKIILSKDILKIVKIFGVYIIICILSTIFGIYKGYVSNYMLGILFIFRKVEYFVMIFLGYIFISEEKDMKDIYIFIDISFIILSLIAILQSLGIVGGFLLGNSISNVGSRVYSTFSGPYEYGAYLLILLPIYLSRLINNYPKAYNFFMLCLVIVNIILTESRTSLVTAIFIIIMMVLSEKKYSIKKPICVSLMCIFLIFISINIDSIFNDSKKLERFETLKIDDMINSALYAIKYGDFETFIETNSYYMIANGSDLSFDIRISKWGILLDGFSKNPILGVGLSTTKEAVDGNYIRYIAESGILGFSVWIIFIFSIYKYLKRNSYNRLELNSMLRYGLISLLITAIFIDIFEASKIMMFYWFILGIYLKDNLLKSKNNNY